MKRNINIVCPNYISNLTNFQSVSIDNVDSIIDCSVDTIVYFCMEMTPKDIGKKLFDVLCSKLRPQGTIVIKFTDLYQTCKNYIDYKISNSNLIDTCKSILNPLSIDEIITYVDINKYKTINISRDNSYIIVTIQRVNL